MVKEERLESLERRGWDYRRRNGTQPLRLRLDPRQTVDPGSNSTASKQSKTPASMNCILFIHSRTSVVYTVNIWRKTGQLYKTIEAQTTFARRVPAEHIEILKMRASKEVNPNAITDASCIDRNVYVEGSGSQERPLTTRQCN